MVKILILVIGFLPLGIGLIDRFIFAPAMSMELSEYQQEVVQVNFIGANCWCGHFQYGTAFRALSKTQYL